MKIAIVDVCHTLYKENTTFSFIDFVREKKKKQKSILKNRFVKNLLIVLGRLTKKDIYRAIYIRYLKGISQSELNYLAREYYQNVLLNSKIDETFNIIESKTDYHYFLCSASLDVIIQAIVDSNGLFQNYFYSSELKYDGDICSGKLKKDLLGHKHLYVKKLDWLLTDNISDLKLAKIASETTIISNKKNIPHWNKHGFKVDIII